ncbi:MAG: rod shape-determining protein MreC [Hyphomicrobium aestuarii]|nr:rod shape-determining protein MreC [Hyphomicrobium aestuarii]
MSRDNAGSSRFWYRRSVTAVGAPTRAFGFLTRSVIIATLGLLLMSKANPSAVEPLREAVVAPFRSVLTVTAGTMSSAIGLIATTTGRLFARDARDRRHVSPSENGGMTAHIADLQREIADLKRENSGLRALVPLAGNRAYNLKSVFVIGGSATGASSRVLIAAGRDDGIRPGYPVVMGNRLLGRVHHVHAATAVVVRLADRLSRVPVMVGAGETRALLVGNGAGGATLELIGQGPAPRAGDPVVTSGIGGVFPRGLMIGRVFAPEDGASTNAATRVSIDSEAAYEPVAGVMMIDGAVFDQVDLPGRQSEIGKPSPRLAEAGARTGSAMLSLRSIAAGVARP